MIRAKTRWAVAPWDEASQRQAEQLANRLHLSPLVARLLVQRGLTDADEARSFLAGGEEQLHDPYLLKGMKEAVDRIHAAVQNGEKIRIYGDYDADGVSSTSLLISLMRTLQSNYDYYIPHRALEGYGLNCAALDKAAEDGVGLIVTVDTGISAYDEVKYAKQLGIDVIVTDHHEPPALLPDAYAVINPKQKDCSYPFEGLAGVGVAFKLAQALLGRPPIEWSHIAALGTVADLMPLQGENRILVKLGLARMRMGEHAGFRALAEVAGMDLSAVTSTSIAFGMAPRINAAGRLDHASKAVELLTKDDYDDAIHIAAVLDGLNRERQRIVESIVKEAEQGWAEKAREAAKSGAEPPAVIVLAGEGWNVGVIGIVASKLLERHYKPVLILGIDENGQCKGSARSIEGYDLHAALTACEDLLDHYGGHQAAAGMSLHKERLGELERRLSLLALEWLTDEDWIPKTKIDFSCKVEEATLQTIEELAGLEPYGAGNPAPRLLFQEAKLLSKRTMGKEAKHLKLSLGNYGRTLDAVGFGYGEHAPILQSGKVVDLVGELSINEWNGERKPQLHIHDLRYEPMRERFPERAHFGEVYQLLRRMKEAPIRGLSDKISGMTNWSPSIIMMMVQVFEELELITRNEHNLVVVESPMKRDLITSDTYRAAKLHAEGTDVSSL
ncbi:single-stranded-DNA-specific exonuclease RecJ [Paenibacillus sp. GCM10023252]|uniref:single-stranded-DNA-specific exonuclease RecJ n=1 Tax=Paenibacillus sp. GCM10023252 TaxID=3252649 RepID=UPI00361B635A